MEYCLSAHVDRTHTGLDRRMSHRIWNRGSNGLPKLARTYAPSILFPVRYPAIGPGTCMYVRRTTRNSLNDGRSNPTTPTLRDHRPLSVRKHGEGRSGRGRRESRYSVPSTMRLKDARGLHN